MNEATILHWFWSSWPGVMTREITWLWPVLEIMHFIGLCLLFGSLLVVDLRILGVGKRVPLAEVMPFIPVALGGFAMILISGICFFCANPPNYWDNYAFRAKMAFVVVGGVNALVFELHERRRLCALDIDVDAGWDAKLIAAGSLATWIIVMSLGRLLPFTGGMG
jgi:hypothetical protein